MTHTVQKGESLWKISKMYGVSLEALIAYNPQIANPDQIDVGQIINIPSGGPGWAEAPVPSVQEPPTPDAMTPTTTPTPTPTPQPTTPPTPPSTGSTLPTTTPPPISLPTPAPPSSEPPMPSTPPSIGAPIPSTTPEQSYPSVPKWEGLWKYVVKNGDTLFKIAKQVGVTLDQLKAANPQVPNPDKIYPGQVLNIPSSSLKSKGGSSYSSLKEQLTAPIAVPPVTHIPPVPQFPKEILTQPKEMVTMEKPTPMPAPMPTPHFEVPLEFNLQFAPHSNKENIIQYAPHTENVQVQMQQASDPKTAAKQEATIGNPHMHMAQQMMPWMHHPMYYLPVSFKKHKKCGCKCHKKHKCGCHHHHHPHHWMMWHHPHYHMMMQQQMSMYPKTFYREED